MFRYRNDTPEGAPFHNTFKPRLQSWRFATRLNSVDIPRLEVGLVEKRDGREETRIRTQACGLRQDSPNTLLHQKMRVERMERTKVEMLPQPNNARSIISFKPSLLK